MIARAILADDERLMREQLRKRLAEAWPELSIVAEAKNGIEAVAAVQSHRPALAFLDIRMPGKTGLEAAREIAGLGIDCHIVFVTAYDAHAVEAFEQGAVDYLLKPAEPARLALTVKRLQQRLSQPASGEAPWAAVLARLDALAGKPTTPANPVPVMPATPAGKPYLQWIQAGLGQQIHLLAAADVVYLQAQDKYTAVATAQDIALVRKPIREFIDELDPAQFWQIHRGTVVAVRDIASVQRDGERLTVLLRSRPERLEVSRSFASRFRQM